jgi:hypothetical protein
MRLLGFERANLSSLDGRPLEECLSRPCGEAGRPRQETLPSRRGSFRQVLRRTFYQGRAYLDGGHREA